MLTNRRLQIFKAIVDEFIQTAEPVGSKTLMEKYDLPYSSATIRNDMMILEEMGYLEKTHTSSGRVPSSEGYRFYCEHLLENKLDEKTALMVQDIFSDRTLNLEDSIQKTCDILSQMTNLASGALGPDAAEQRLEHIKMFPLDERSAVVVFITNRGHTENKTFQFQDAVSIEDMTNCCEILNDRLKGTPLNEVVDKMEAIYPILAQRVQRHEMLFKAFVGAFVKFAQDNVYFSGQSNLLYQPEFSDLTKLKELMTMIDNQEIWRSLSSHQEQHLALQTHDRTQLVWMDDVAVVTSPIRINEVEQGKLMVVGPARMDYDRIVSMLETISITIEKIYKGGK